MRKRVGCEYADVGVACDGQDARRARSRQMLRSLPVLAFFALLTSCYDTVRGGEAALAERQNGAGNIYYRTQSEADLSLVRFDREHPQCQLWTNWQKTCSRTGQNGATVCVTDQGWSERPSAPFCVPTISSGRGGPFTETERASSMRFCAATRQERVVDATGTFLFEETICHRYRIERPFNGRSLEARNHPSCLRWSPGEGDVLTCELWAPSSCRLQDGLPRRRSQADLANQIIIERAFQPEGTAVLGVSCQS